jgi:hypothetical protein
VIEHAGHGSARVEDQRHGGWHHRFLNVTGRWSANGTRAIPLLAWSDGKQAEAVATIASKARNRPIIVSSLGGNGLFADQFVAFGEHHAAALLGNLPYATAAARKLEELRIKTIAFACAVLRVHRATAGEERERLLKSEGRLLLQTHSANVFSATQFLAGRKAAEILAILEAGELDTDGKLFIEQLHEAILLAKSYA